MRLIIPLLLLLSFVFRLVNLSSVPSALYWDELDAGYQAYSLLRTGRDYNNQPLPFFPLSFADARTPIPIYTTVAPVSIFGLSNFATRLPSVLWGVLGIAVMYVLASYLSKSTKIGFLSAVVLALTPWHFHYSRIAFEPVAEICMLLVSFALFFRSFKNSKLLPISGLFFGLTLYTYSTSKLFIPIALIFVSLIYKNELLKLPKTLITKTLLIFLVVSLPFIIDSVVGKNNQRFTQLVISTDPTLRTEVNSDRFFSLASAKDAPPEVGSSPRIIDRVLFNVPQRLGTTLVKNYLSTFSTDFLFITGDPQLRHSPGKTWMGQFLWIDFVTLIAGLIFISSGRTKVSKFVITWLLLAPLPAIITRDGSMHASRLMLILPVLSFIISVGVYVVLTRTKYLRFVYMIGLIVCVVNIYGYYFTMYKLESAYVFGWGHSQIISEAKVNESKYDHIFIDTHHEYALMAYLFNQKFDPHKFHELLPLKVVSYGDNFQGVQFEKIVILQPRTRVWTDAHIPGNSLIFAAFDQPVVGSYKPMIKTISFPDLKPAFYVFSRSN